MWPKIRSFWSSFEPSDTSIEGELRRMSVLQLRSAHRQGVRCGLSSPESRFR